MDGILVFYQTRRIGELEKNNEESDGEYEGIRKEKPFSPARPIVVNGLAKSRETAFGIHRMNLIFMGGGKNKNNAGGKSDKRDIL